MYILGIETSCDETAAAVLKIDRDKLSVLSSIVNSQVAIHKKYGGVIPELAAREHLKNILLVIEVSLAEASIKMSEIGLIAVTQGPGLATSLMVGLETAKTLAWARQIRLVGVNHLTGHLWSWSLPQIKETVALSQIEFPFIALLVSGGHTELVLVKTLRDYKLLGRTLDDAAGEAFDKVAKLLSLGYPGGPEIARAAKKGDRLSYNFPCPLLNSNNYDFSFAGLKTAVLYTLKKIDRLEEQTVNDLAASFQAAALEVLVRKTIKAAVEHRVASIVVAGGVSANQELRKMFVAASVREKFSLHFPHYSYTGDNAAMIAWAGYLTGNKSNYLQMKVEPNLTIA